MPRVRLTYHKDIAREGTDIIDVDDGRARVLLNMRRAVLVETKPKSARKRTPAAKNTTSTRKR